MQYVLLRTEVQRLRVLAWYSFGRSGRYTLNFVDMRPRLLGLGLVLFPVLVLASSFPIVTISLRENLIELALRVARVSRANSSSKSCCSWCVGVPGLDDSVDNDDDDDDDDTTGNNNKNNDKNNEGDDDDGNNNKSNNNNNHNHNNNQPHQRRRRRRLRVAAACAVLAPTVALVLLTEDVGLVVAVTGSVLGAMMQWLFPAVFVHYARRECRQRLARRQHQNPHPRQQRGGGGAMGDVVPVAAVRTAAASAGAARQLAAANPYTSRCNCAACTAFIVGWSVLSIAFGLHNLLTASR